MAKENPPTEKVVKTRRPIAGETVQYLPVGSTIWCAAIVTGEDVRTGEISLYALRAEWNSVEWHEGVKEGAGQRTWRSLAAARAARDLDEAKAANRE